MGLAEKKPIEAHQLAFSLSFGVEQPEEPKVAPAPLKTPQNTIVNIESVPTGHKPLGENALSDIFQKWQIGSFEVPNATEHTTELSETITLASVSPEPPSYKPLLDSRLIDEGILSDAQLEGIILAGEAFSVVLPQYFVMDADLPEVIRKQDDNDEKPIVGAPFQVRQGFFIGDSTGVGKGRQVAAIVLDQKNRGQKKALWFSKSATLLEDAQRDWEALYEEPNYVVPISRWKQTDTIKMEEGILFSTYATLRTPSGENKQSRLEQIVNWLGRDFDGLIVFDESHALSNATGTTDDTKGGKKPSMQGTAALRLQNLLPNARVLYVSATGASSINSLAYTSRLGLWQQPHFPFQSRENFISEMIKGGISTAEILSKELKSRGLYISRSLSLEGVEIEVIDVPLTDEQKAIYNTWADAFKVIHNNLHEALKETGIVRPDGKSADKNKKKTLLSVFESTKQRFFLYLLLAMKANKLIHLLEQDIKNGFAPVIQIQSTNEALMNRVLADLPNRNKIERDITPKDAILEYLWNAFPVKKHKEKEDDAGNIKVVEVMDGNDEAIIDPIALKMRDEMVDKILEMPALPTLLDRLIWHFGTNTIAEITGRRSRLVRGQ